MTLSAACLPTRTFFLSRPFDQRSLRSFAREMAPISSARGFVPSADDIFDKMRSADSLGFSSVGGRCAAFCALQALPRNLGFSVLYVSGVIAGPGASASALVKETLSAAGETDFAVLHTQNAMMWSCARKIGPCFPGDWRPDPTLAAAWSSLLETLGRTSSFDPCSGLVAGCYPHRLYHQRPVPRQGTPPVFLDLGHKDGVLVVVALSERAVHRVMGFPVTH